MRLCYLYGVRRARCDVHVKRVVCISRHRFSAQHSFMQQRAMRRGAARRGLARKKRGVHSHVKLHRARRVYAAGFISVALFIVRVATP